MKNTNWLKLAKTTLRENYFTKPLYHFLYKKYSAYQKTQTIKYLNTKGVALIKNLLTDIAQAPQPTFAVYGTLLGIIRENGFIPHDCDVDFGVLTKNQPLSIIKNYLESKGYRISRAFILDNELTEFSILIGKINVDFFAYCNRDNLGFGTYDFFNLKDSPLPQENQTRVAYLTCSPITELTTYTVDNVVFNIPQNAERYLAETYTADWRIPNPNWTSTNNPNRKILDGKIGEAVTF